MFKFRIKCTVKRLDTRLDLSSIADITLWPIFLFISLTLEGQFGRLRGVFNNLST